MMHTDNPIERDVISLFENGSLHVNDMREFFAESVCKMLDDGMNPMEHHEAAIHIFDMWYRNLRKTIWTNGAEYALTKTGWTKEKARTESDAMYRKAYRNIDRKRRKEEYRED